MLVIGLDVGETTGVCICRISNLIVEGIELKEIRCSQVDEYFLYNTAKLIENELESFEPDLVVIEGYAFGRGFFNISQPEITSQIKRFMVDRKILFFEANVMSMRKILTGNGRSSKKDCKDFAVSYLIAKGFGIKGRKSSHAYDACLPAILGAKFLCRELDSEVIKLIEESIIGGKDAGYLLTV